MYNKVPPSASEALSELLRSSARIWNERFHGNDDDEADVCDARICGKYRERNAGLLSHGGDGGGPPATSNQFSYAA